MHFRIAIWYFCEDANEDGLAGNWQRLNGGAWMIPEDAIAGEVYDWLYTGNWYLYNATMSIDSFPKKRKQIRAWLVESGIRFYLNSFHDNDPWTIGGCL